MHACVHRWRHPRPPAHTHTPGPGAPPPPPSLPGCACGCTCARACVQAGDNSANYQALLQENMAMVGVLGGLRDAKQRLDEEVCARRSGS
jgi:hypothetical protein